jgi:hypothetical protein
MAFWALERKVVCTVWIAAWKVATEMESCEIKYLGGQFAGVKAVAVDWYF